MQQPVSMFCLCGLTVLWGIGLCILGSVGLGSWAVLRSGSLFIYARLGSAGQFQAVAVSP